MSKHSREKARKNTAKQTSDEKSTLQRVAVNTTPTRDVPDSVQDTLHSPGQPLDAATRAYMEPRFGQDFSNVRVHTNEQAAESASAVDARAYTVGKDVVFGEGEYAPGTSQGKQLLAHELTHTIQQSKGHQNSLAVNQPGDQYEQEAHRVSQAIDQHTVSAVAQKADMNVMRQVAGPEAPSTLGVGDKIRQEIANEVKTKIGELVQKSFGGDNKKAFDHFDSNKDGSIDKKELIALLKAAGVKERFMIANYGDIAQGIIDKFDKNKNGKIEWDEFEATIRG